MSDPRTGVVGGDEHLTWVLRTEPGSSEGAGSVLTYGGFSLAPEQSPFYFQLLHNHMRQV